MRKILLIQPVYTRAYSEWIAPPLGLAYLASTLEQEGHKIRIFDMQLEEENLDAVVHSFRPEIVGVTSTTPSYGELVKILCSVNDFDSTIKTAVGGPHPTALPEEVVSEPFIDLVIYGEGENTVTELFNDNNGFTEEELKKIDGIAFKTDPGFTKTKPRPLIKDLDSLPFPAHHLLDIKKYSHPSARYLAFFTSSINLVGT